MCGIFASFDCDKLKELHKLNAYRGSLSYSICGFKRYHTSVIPSVLYSAEGDLPDDIIDHACSMDKNTYMVAHVQAPTTQSGGRHPAAADSGMLWHNGIIKQKEIPEGTWDTLWLLYAIKDYGFDYLSRVDGTFACVLFSGDTLYVFRNEISPLFVDKDLNISSTKFDGSEELEPNKVFVIALAEKKLECIHRFRTKQNPYYFGV